MIKIPHKEAKGAILKVCNDALDGRFSTREAFMRMLQANPHIAVQGYNHFGRIFFWNRASSSIYGYSKEEALGQDLVELLLPENMQKLARDVIISGSKSGKMPAAGACDLLRSTGEYVSVYSGHLIFEWADSSGPEFYCIDLAVDYEPATGNPEMM